MLQAVLEPTWGKWRTVLELKCDQAVTSSAETYIEKVTGWLGTNMKLLKNMVGRTWNSDEQDWDIHEISDE